MIVAAKRLVTAMGLKPVAVKVWRGTIKSIAAIQRFHVVTRKHIRYRLDLTEVIDVSIFSTGEWESETCQFLRKELCPGHTVLEVGANIGAHTLPMAKLCAPGHVFAFEPTEYACGKLRQNLALNPEISNVTLIQTMVSNHDHALPKDDISGSFPLFHDASKGETAKPGCLSLDEFAQSAKLTSVHLLKIDVDGYDYKVLQGATRILREHKPVVLIELYSPSLAALGDSVSDIHTLLEENGYRLERMLTHNAVFRACD
ncbi:MAG TPA: FkbM family methyltransferase [Candidatus Angelobacter sp.]|nr:FkbM family methyltransferase [Candidatus Angelobacter sp.]